MTRLLIITLFCMIHATTFAQKPIQPLLDSLEKHLTTKKIPGAMISIVTADTILYQGGLGVTNVETGEKVNESHLFRQGSVSKPFTALGVVKLLQNSTHNLQSPVKEIDPSIKMQNKWEAKIPITIEHLLEHTAGFDDMHLHAMVNRTDDTAPSTKELVKSHQQSLTARWQPGTRKSYSNPGYVLAGHIIETLSNRTYHSYLKEEILLPIGMETAGFYFKAPSANMVRGHELKKNNIRPIDFVSIQGGPAGELCANATDMSKYLQFMLNKAGDQINLDEQLFDRIEYPRSSLSAKAGLKNGYGLGNYTSWRNGALFHGHNGAIDGFSSACFYSREADIGVSVAINRMGNANEIAQKVLDYYLGKVEEVPQESVEIPETIREKYDGYYTFRSPRNELVAFSDIMFGGIRLDFKADHVLVKNLFGKQKDSLTYAGNNQFYMGKSGYLNAILLVDTPDATALTYYDSYAEKESYPMRMASNILVWLSWLAPFFFLFFFLFWAIVQLFRKKKANWKDLIILALACLFYALMIVGFGSSLANITSAGTLSVWSGLLYVSSFLFSAFTFLSIWRATQLKGHVVYKIYYWLNVSAVVILFVFFISYGFIGLKLWAY
ncbi:MAG: beta-lactamase family protein [Saprospiraceae bacterium]|nr:beta-lactamase family protein [Saprospiraceae bacterium]